MFSFIIKRQPKSYNSWRGATNAKKQGYKAAMESSFHQFYTKYTLYSNSDLYGLIYYFYKKDLNNDADNISKPLWDCLRGFLL